MIKDSPKSIKFSRCFRLKLNNNVRNTYLSVNNLNYGLKALNYGWIDSIQLNSILRLIRIIFKKKYKMKLNSSLIFPITKKPLETRMGSGKAERKFWKCPVMKGMIIIEFGQITEDQIVYIFNVIKNRLPFLIKIVRVIY